MEACARAPRRKCSSRRDTRVASGPQRRRQWHRWTMPLLFLFFVLATSAPRTSCAAESSSGEPRPQEADISEWPEELFGDSVRGPFVRPFELKAAESCRGMFVQHPSNPLVGGEHIPADAMKEAFELSSKIKVERTKGPSRPLSPGELRNMTAQGCLRALVIVIEGGFGNNLMEVGLAMSYAFLSGRRALRAEFGPFRQGLQAMCRGFNCSVHMLASGMNPFIAADRIDRLSDEEMVASLGDPTPLRLIGAHACVGNLTAQKKEARCLLDSFSCTSLRCLHSKQLNMFLVGPTAELEAAVRRSVTVLGPTTDLVWEWKSHLAPQQDWQELHAQLARLLDELARAEDGMLGRRELTSNGVSSVTSLGQSLQGSQLGNDAPRLLLANDSGTESEARPVPGGAERGLESELDLDAQSQTEAGSLSQPTVGAVSPAITSSQGQGSEPRPGSDPPSRPKRDMLHLEFDVAVHVRTVSKCVENNPFGAGCRSASLGQTLQRAYTDKHLMPFLRAADWVCMSSLLVYLHQVKLRLNHDKQQQRQPLHFPERSVARFLLGRFLQTISPGDVSGVWTVSDAVAFAQGALPLVSSSEESWQGPASKDPPVDGTRRQPKATLRILLATDSERLRPLLVEFLRPFGTVVFSNGTVAHTGSWPGTERHEPRPGDLMNAKLDSLAEFFLLSKAHVAVNFGIRRSSFLAQASAFGNSTFIARTKRPQDPGCQSSCCFQVRHAAEAS